MATSTSTLYWQLLQKEMDYIEGTVKNLDDIINKTKNFTFLIWGGSLLLLTQNFPDDGPVPLKIVLLLTGVIPLLFWAVDYRWRRHLIFCAQRKEIISDFINSSDFEELIAQGKDLPAKGRFPFYDPIGSIYTQKNFEKKKKDLKTLPGNIKDGELELKLDYSARYLIDDKKIHFFKVVFHKDAPFYYGALVLLSILFGIMTPG